MIHRHTIRRIVLLGLAVFTPCTVVSQSGISSSGADIEPADTYDDSRATLTALLLMVEDDPENVDTLLRLGRVQLTSGLHAEAEETFKKARDLERSRPEAYVGLGRVHAERPSRGSAAYFGFRRALGLARRAIKIDSTYAPAYLLLGELYERFQEDHAKAVESYLKYVTLEPENAEGLYYFGLALVQAGEYDKIDQHIAPFVEVHPDQERLMPLVAMGYFYLERYEAALELFERYLQRIPDEERGLYTDISLVASEKEMHAFRSIEDPAARDIFLNSFWLRRDSDILTSINERIIEHYRRVWYARTYFSRRADPWDRRGEVYIRYGEPDFRSRSSNRQLIVSPAVETVRTRMAVDMYGSEASYLTFTGPVFPIRKARDPTGGDQAVPRATLLPDDSEQDVSLDLDASESSPGESQSYPDLDLGLEATGPYDFAGNPNLKLNFADYGPVTLTDESETVPWETWTYTQLFRGVEFTFTDEIGTGHFDFAPIPPVPSGDNKIANSARMMQYAPGVLYQRASAESPDYYRPGPMSEPLNFFYDYGVFQSEGGGSRLEVYYGVPPSEVQVLKTDTGHLIQVESAVALANADHTSILRRGDLFSYVNQAEFNRERGMFVPDQLELESPPGKYTLQVKLKDALSGKVGIFKQSVEIPDYAGESLKLSSILLASSVGESGVNPRFKKGDVWVTPMPTRTFSQTQTTNAFFEIYNLLKDEFGQTHYKIQYRVRFSSKGSVGLAGMLTSGVRAIMRRGKPEVQVTFEQTGSESFSREYVELDLGNARSGINDLEVTVTDLVSATTASEETVFFFRDGKE